MQLLIDYRREFPRLVLKAIVIDAPILTFWSAKRLYKRCARLSYIVSYINQSLICMPLNVNRSLEEWYKNSVAKISLKLINRYSLYRFIKILRSLNWILKKRIHIISLLIKYLREFILNVLFSSKHAKMNRNQMSVKRIMKKSIMLHNIYKAYPIVVLNSRNSRRINSLSVTRAIFYWYFNYFREDYQLSAITMSNFNRAGSTFGSLTNDNV